MINNNFFKVTCHTPLSKLMNPIYNAKLLINEVDKNNNSLFHLFPECYLSGYSLEDLYFDNDLINDIYKSIDYIIKNNKSNGVIIVGSPLLFQGSLYNCAIIIYKNEIIGIVPKNILANSYEFYEKRYFKSGNTIENDFIKINNKKYPIGNSIFTLKNYNINFCVEICEDLWANNYKTSYLASKGCQLIFNLSASNEVIGKNNKRVSAIIDSSRRNSCAYIYASSNYSESTSSTVFSGKKIVAINGELIFESNPFEKESSDILIDLGYINYIKSKNTNLHYDFGYKLNYVELEINVPYNESKDIKIDIEKYPFLNMKNKDFDEVIDIVTHSLYQRLEHIDTNTTIIGLSGGLDSTIALLFLYLTYEKFGIEKSYIKSITLPSIYTKESINRVEKLIKGLGLSLDIINIKDTSNQLFKLLDVVDEDLVFENTQSRLRMNILMNLANKYDGIVIGTSDMSEMALGFSTFGADNMGMYNLNAGLPKTMLQGLIKYFMTFDCFKGIKDVLLDVYNAKISPELKDEQYTEEIIGKYDINDFILYRKLFKNDSKERLYYLVKEMFNLSEIESINYVNRFLKLFYSSNYKRTIAPDFPKVFEISLNSKYDYRIVNDIKREI